MKKISLLLISLLLALSLLAGCALPEYTTTFVVTENEGELRGELVHFDEIEYIRPDMDAAAAVAEELFSALRSPLSFHQVDRLLDEFYELYSNFDTMYVLGYIRSCQDMGNEYYAGEYTWLMEADAQMQQLTEKVYSACANSLHAFWLEPLKFWEGFREEYGGEAEQLPGHERYTELVREEAGLLARYRATVAAPTVEIDGREWLLEEYVAQAMPYQQAGAYQCYYEKYNAVLGEIYLELISVRREMAELMGYESYAAMEYELSYSRDYSPEQSEQYMEHIKRHMAPLGRELTENEVFYSVEYLPTDPGKLMELLKTAAEGFGGSLEEAFEFMLAHGLYDFEQSVKKADTSFQTYLADYDAPYLFLNPYGDSWDIMTVFHEFGHYADSFIRYNAEESMDLAESFAQAMQFLALPELKSAMSGEELEKLYKINLLDMANTCMQQAALAEFELRAYEMEEPTVEKLNELSLQLSKDYGYYDEYNAQIYSYVWSDTPHLFESPFYVISYPVSAAVALELYELELEKEGAGTAKFIEMSESRLAGLMETVELAGLHYPLAEERVKDMAELLRRSILG